MDPLAMAGTALKAFQQVKEALDEAAAALEEGRKLLEVMEIFEITIAMIPRREEKFISEKVQENERLIGAPEEETLVDKIKNKGKAIIENAAKPTESANIPLEGDNENDIALEVVDARVEKVGASKGLALSSRLRLQNLKIKLAEVTASGFEALVDAVNDPLKLEYLRNPFSEANKDPLGISKNKKRAQDLLQEMRLAGASDMVITFAGMNLICLKAAETAASAVAILQELENPSWFWTCMPWKIKKQIGIKEEIESRFQGLRDFTQQLQNAISVASYAVSLESLESALDSSAVLENPAAKSFWRKRIGKNKMWATPEEFLSGALSELKVHFPKDPMFPRDSHVLFGRFLEKICNPDRDSKITVDEFAEISEKIEGNPFEVLYTTRIRKAMDNFLSGLDFKMKTLEISEGVYRVKPFQQIQLEFEPSKVWEENTYDCVTLVKFTSNFQSENSKNSREDSKKAQRKLSVQSETKMKAKEVKDQRVYFAAGYDDPRILSVTPSKNGKRDVYGMVWALELPGLYQVKLCLDSFDDSEFDSFNLKAREASWKSYYGNGPMIEVEKVDGLCFGAYIDDPDDHPLDFWGKDGWYPRPAFFPLNNTQALKWPADKNKEEWEDTEEDDIGVFYYSVENSILGIFDAKSGKQLSETPHECSAYSPGIAVFSLDDILEKWIDGREYVIGFVNEVGKLNKSRPMLKVTLTERSEEEEE